MKIVQKNWFGFFKTWSGLWGQVLGPAGTADWDLDLTILPKSIATKANFKNLIMFILSILFLRMVLVPRAVCGFISKGLLPIEVLIFY